MAVSDRILFRRLVAVAAGEAAPLTESLGLTREALERLLHTYFPESPALPPLGRVGGAVLVDGRQGRALQGPAAGGTRAPSPCALVQRQLTLALALALCLGPHAYKSPLQLRVRELGDGPPLRAEAGGESEW